MRSNFARFLKDVNIFSGKFGLGASGIVLRNHSREMQRTSKAPRTRAHNQNIRVQPLSLDTHSFNRSRRTQRSDAGVSEV